MAFELKEGQGTLRKNGYKNKPNQPDYRGDVKVGGVVKEIAAWIKEGPRGKYMSLQISEKRPSGATASLPRAEEPQPQQQDASVPQPSQERKDSKGDYVF